MSTYFQNWRQFLLSFGILLICGNPSVTLALDDDARTRLLDAQRIANAEVAKIEANLAKITNAYDEAKKRAEDYDKQIRKAEALRATKDRVTNDRGMDPEDRARTLRTIDRAERQIAGDRDRAASAATEAKNSATQIETVNRDLAAARKKATAATHEVQTLKWLCNFAHEYHDSPNECTDQKKGGQWVHIK